MNHSFKALVAAAAMAVHALSPAGQARHAAAERFDQAVAGFPECRLPGLHVDLETGRPASPYFSRHRLTPCETTDTLTSYCLQERFHGLPVTRLTIPNTTFPVFALYFDADLATARKSLKRALGSEFEASKKSRAGIALELLADPRDASRSVLVCTKEF